MSTSRLIRAVFLGFLPTCAVVLLALLGGVALIAPQHVTASAIASVVAELAGLTVGFAAALRLGGARLEAPRGLKRRSMAAGSIAPLLAGAIARVQPDAGYGGMVLLSIPAGALAAALVIALLLGFGDRLVRAGAGQRGQV